MSDHDSYDCDMYATVCQHEVDALREKVEILRWLHAESSWWMNRWEPSFHGGEV